MAGQPIASLISGERLNVARMQDAVMRLIYDRVQPDAVLYGGTAVWRCYDGGRFSEDIDIYVGRGFGRKFADEAHRSGIGIVWKDPVLPLHMRLSDGTTEMLLEASVGAHNSRIEQYEMVDGTSMTISALGPEELMVRKMEAYGGRRLIRDIYDIFHLTNYARKGDYYVVSKLRPFLDSIREPVDAGILGQLIYKGRNDITFGEMVDYLKRWAGEV